jgi:hypothetical protein
VHQQHPARPEPPKRKRNNAIAALLEEANTVIDWMCDKRTWLQRQRQCWRLQNVLNVVLSAERFASDQSNSSSSSSTSQFQTRKLIFIDSYFHNLPQDRKLADLPVSKLRELIQKLKHSHEDGKSALLEIAAFIVNQSTSSSSASQSTESTSSLSSSLPSSTSSRKRRGSSRYSTESTNEFHLPSVLADYFPIVPTPIQSFSGYDISATLANLEEHGNDPDQAFAKLVPAAQQVSKFRDRSLTKPVEDGYTRVMAEEEERREKRRAEIEAARYECQVQHFEFIQNVHLTVSEW